jgi:hypothetical protein
MKIQDHFLAIDLDEDTKRIRHYGVLTVNNACIESPRFHEKALAEKWLATQCEAYRKA